MESPKEFKIIRLPRNGPKVGQSADQWQHGKDKGDNDWNRKKRRYSWRQMRPNRQ